VSKPDYQHCSIQVAEFFTAIPLHSVVGTARRVTIHISLEEILSIASGDFPEAIAIQRLLTLANFCSELTIEWGASASFRVFSSPSLFPFFAVLLCVENAEHRTVISEFGHSRTSNKDAAKARKLLLDYRLKVDAFMDCQIVVCADSLGRGYPLDLYASAGILNNSVEMEALVEDLMVRHLPLGVNQSKSFRLREILGVIVSELFENTDIHGRRDLDGKPISKNAIRGLILKRVQRIAKEKTDTGKTTSVRLDYLELSIFDSGTGYYPSFKRLPLNDDTSIKEEWEVVHMCIARHVSANLPDSRPGYRGMGLYEVLRALKEAAGYIEFRTGRVHAFRTFLMGDMRMQLEPRTSDTRPGMPKPVLLDAEKQYLTIPTMQEKLTGSSVRVLFPLI